MLKYVLTIDPEEGKALLETSNGDKHYEVDGTIPHITQAMFKLLRLDLNTEDTRWTEPKPEEVRYDSK